MTTRTIASFIDDEVHRRLTGASPEQAALVAKVIVREANRRRMDPLFLMAIVQHERHFHMGPDALRGHLTNSRQLPKIYATKVLSEYASQRNELAASLIEPGSIAPASKISANIAMHVPTELIAQSDDKLYER